MRTLRSTAWPPRVVGWWLATLGLTAARLWLAARVPLGDDEGYYWVWSRHFAASYYDHPPLVAWLAGASTHLLGNSLLALRLPFVICGTLTALTLRALVAEATGDVRLAANSSLLIQVVPVFFALGFMVIPDTPLMLFWLLAARAAWRFERRSGLAAAALLGLALGGASLSKYIAVLLSLSLGAHLLQRPGRRPIGLLTIALVIALLISSPVLWWNATHDWASFRYQFSTRHHGPHFESERLLLYTGSQALFLSPVLFVLVGAAALAGFRHREREEPGDRLLWWLGAPTACWFLAAAGFTSFKPNWAAPAYPTLVVLAVRALSRRGTRAPRFARAIGVAMAVTAIAFSVVPIVHLARPVLPLPAGADPTCDMAGWPAIAARAGQVAARIEGETGRPPFFAAGRYQIASRLEFYLPGHPAVVSLHPGRDAYDDWQDLQALAGRDFVFVASDRFSAPPERLVPCDSARIDTTLVTAVRRNEQFHATIYDVRGVRPEPR